MSRCYVGVCDLQKFNDGNNTNMPYMDYDDLFCRTTMTHDTDEVPIIHVSDIALVVGCFLVPCAHETRCILVG